MVASKDRIEAEIWPLEDGSGWSLRIIWPSGVSEKHDILGAGDEFMATICEAIRAYEPVEPTCSECGGEGRRLEEELIAALARSSNSAATSSGGNND